MTDYISREWLLNQYDRQHKGPAGNARKLIENAPAEDVAPVVRCKDCKYKQGSVCDYSNVYIHKNGYCNWGKRKQT